MKEYSSMVFILNHSNCSQDYVTDKGAEEIFNKIVVIL